MEGDVGCGVADGIADDVASADGEMDALADGVKL